jgi:hypothetical protein
VARPAPVDLGIVARLILALSLGAEQPWMATKTATKMATKIGADAGKTNPSATTNRARALI